MSASRLEQVDDCILDKHWIFHYRKTTTVNRKHNDVYHHGLGQRVSKEELEAVHARSADQNAEISTEPLHILVNGYFVSGHFEVFGWLEWGRCWEIPTRRARCLRLSGMRMGLINRVRHFRYWLIAQHVKGKQLLL